MPRKSPYLKELITLLKEEEFPIFASKEDADFFRKAYQKVKETPSPILLTPLPSPAISLETPPSKKEEIVKPAPSPVVSKAPPSLSLPKLNPLPASKENNLPSLAKVFELANPQVEILKSPPIDTLAQKRANRWKTKNQITPISILSYEEEPEQLLFLKEIARAIDAYFGPANLLEGLALEKKDEWDTFLSEKSLKLVIVCDYSLWQMQNLRKTYHEVPAKKQRLVKDTPLFLLPDLSLYLKDPSLKRSLWKALCQVCS